MSFGDVARVRTGDVVEEWGSATLTQNGGDRGRNFQSTNTLLKLVRLRTT